jgi:hypothetical protein
VSRDIPTGTAVNIGATATIGLVTSDAGRTMDTGLDENTGEMFVDVTGVAAGVASADAFTSAGDENVAARETVQSMVLMPSPSFYRSRLRRRHS